jgi:hypothetical protein
MCLSSHRDDELNHKVGWGAKEIADLDHKSNAKRDMANFINAVPPGRIDKARPSDR